MSLKRIHTFGVISFGKTKLQEMMNPHPEKPGCFVMKKPGSGSRLATNQFVAEKVSKLIGLHFEKIKWSWRNTGTDHQILYLNCPHNRYVTVSIANDDINPFERREFTVGSRCVECKKAHEVFSTEKKKIPKVDRSVEEVNYTYPATVVKRENTSKPSDFKRLRYKFRETMLSICKSQVDRSIQQVERNYTDDKSKCSALLQDSPFLGLRLNNAVTEAGIIFEENLFIDSDDDAYNSDSVNDGEQGMNTDDITSEKDLEMEVYPEQFKFSSQ